MDNTQQQTTSTDTIAPSVSLDSHVCRTLYDIRCNEANVLFQAFDALKSWTETLDSFRNDLTCRICFKLLYEPYTNPCGHTFCYRYEVSSHQRRASLNIYSCLSQWFVNPSGGAKFNKTCPDCRAAVLTQPAPAYLIKDFTSKLLPHLPHLEDGAPREQYEKEKGDEASILDSDRLNSDPRRGGLFKGVFKDSIAPRLPFLRDVEDGVDRCPGCTWEIEDDSGRCGHCGYMLDPDYESRGSSLTSYDLNSDEHDSVMEAELAGTFPEDFDYDDDEDLDGEFDGQDGDHLHDLEVFPGLDRMSHSHPPQDWAHPHPSIPYYSDSASGTSNTARGEDENDDPSDENSLDYDDDDSLDGFIDDESESSDRALEDSGSEPSPARHQASTRSASRGSRALPMPLSSDDSPLHTTISNNDRPSIRARNESDDDEVQVLPRRARSDRRVAGLVGGRGVRSRHVVLDEDEDDD